MSAQNTEKAASPTTSTRFADLGLPETLLKALVEVGYETPSPIQAASSTTLNAVRWICRS